MKKINDFGPAPLQAQPANKVIPVRLVKRPLTKKQRIIVWIVAAIAAGIIIFCLWYRIGYSSTTYINGSKYQAIFTTNNQAYFGKLQRLSDGAYRMTDVYYLQQAGNTAQKAASDTQTPQLIKMGSELHGPEDEIIFDGNQVLFWENLKADSKVAKAIAEYKKK